MRTKLLQWGNSKLSFPVFNIPATKEICGRVCKDCYSHKAYRIFPSVLPAQQKRYEASLQPDFVSRIKTELNSFKKSFSYVRIHASAGEFYSQLYLNNWIRIAKAFPTILFYAYTKKIKHLDFSVAKQLSNFIVIDSFHYKQINYGKLSEAPLKAFICPHQKKTTIICGSDCTWCMQKYGAETNGVYFIKH